MPDRVKCIILDIDGTLYDQKPVRRAMAIRLIRSHLFRPFLGLRTLKALKAYRHAQEDLRSLDEADDPATQQIAIASEQSGQSTKFVEAIVEQWMFESPLDLLLGAMRPGLMNFLKSAQSRQIALAALSDYPAAAKLKRLGVDEYLNAVASAQDAAVRRFKPDPAGIVYLMKQLNMEPSETLMVGDRPEVDAQAAQAAGVSCAIVGSGDFAHGAHGCVGFEGFPGLALTLFGETT